MRLVVSPQAEQDIETIGDYIAQDNPVRALTFITQLRDQCERITGSPSGYQRRVELGEGIRSCPYGSYVIFFESTDMEVIIVRILHGARDISMAFDLGT